MVFSKVCIFFPVESGGTCTYPLAIKSHYPYLIGAQFAHTVLPVGVSMIYRATTPLHVTQVAKSTVGIRPITGGQGIAGVLVIGAAEHRSHLTIVGRRRIISPLT